MKKIFVSCLFFVMIAFHVYSQDTIMVYYDSEWKEISDKNDAVYYRKAFINRIKDWDVIDYYKDGTIQMTGAYVSLKKDVKHGQFTYFAENGQKISEGVYAWNKADGAWNYWNDKGKVTAKGYFKQGVKHGKWTYWNAEGRITVEANFKNNELDGEWYRFFPNGKMKILFNDGISQSSPMGGIVRRK